MNFKKLFLTLSVLIFSELMIVSCSKEDNDYRFGLKANELDHISSYDLIMRSVADSSHFDWQLLSAIAYQESRFRHDVRSNRGAIGLMQIMPRTAKHMGYDVDSLANPRVSIELALKLLHSIENSFRFPKTMKQIDKLKVILAAYNAGPGFIVSVRRQAASEGAAYNDWLTLKGYITRNGTHRQTTQFADQVYNKYTQYLSKSS